VNAGYYRADVGALAAETRNYVPRVLELYGRLKEQFEVGLAPRPELSPRDEKREGKALGVRTSGLLGRPPTPARVAGAATSESSAGSSPKAR
jgi:hypothetical protein